MQRITFIFLCLVFCTSAAFSQDKIYRKNGVTVLAKVIEVGNSEVKYREYQNPEGPIYVLESDRIIKIVFENGAVHKFEENLKDPERYKGQANKAIKLDFLGPLLGYSQVSFEKSLGVGKSYEISIGIIGAGKSTTIYYYNGGMSQEVKRKQSGVFVSGGYKFGKLPDFVFFGKTRFGHVMQGTYLKPILYFGHYGENQIIEKAGNLEEVGRQNVTFGALELELGKQWVFNDKFLLDFYVGLGYAADNKDPVYDYYDWNDNTAAYNYANARLGSSPGLSASFGIKFGMLFK